MVNKYLEDAHTLVSTGKNLAVIPQHNQKVNFNNFTNNVQQPNKQGLTNLKYRY